MTSAPAAITVAVLLAALGLKLTDFTKYLVAAIRYSGGSNAEQFKDALNGITTLVLTSALGFLVVQFMVKPSAWGDEITIGNETLKDLPLGSTIIFGLVFTALAGTLYDFKKAVDQTDNAIKPKLVE